VALALLVLALMAVVMVVKELTAVLELLRLLLLHTVLAAVVVEKGLRLAEEALLDFMVVQEEMVFKEL
jgi:hypothetical protein